MNSLSLWNPLQHFTSVLVALIVMILVPNAFAGPPIQLNRDLPTTTLGVEGQISLPMAVELTYDRRFDELIGSMDLIAGGHLSLPIATQMNPREIQLDGSVGLVVLRWRQLALLTGLGLGYGHSNDVLGSHQSLNISVDLWFGYFASRWFIALSGGYQTAAVTHHSPTGYAGSTAQYRGENWDDSVGFEWHELSAGLTVGGTIRQRVSLYLGLSYEHLFQRDVTRMIGRGVHLPFAAQVGLQVHLGSLETLSSGE